jgi:hypothetical protein
VRIALFFLERQTELFTAPEMDHLFQRLKKNNFLISKIDFFRSLYYVAMNIGNPPKPYFLDVDTGSDLTWLQCDAPCRSCNKVPFLPSPSVP